MALNEPEMMVSKTDFGDSGIASARDSSGKPTARNERGLGADSPPGPPKNN